MTLDPIDAWLAGDGDEDELVAALEDPSTRRDLVELAMIEALLPGVATPPRPAVRSRRAAAIAAIAVVIAMIAVLVMRPRTEIAVASHHVQVALEPGVRAVTLYDRTALYRGALAIMVPDDRPHVVDTPVGPVTLAPGTHATLRASPAPAALYVDVITGSAEIAGDSLPAGRRAAFGDRLERRRLGPRIVVTVLAIEGNRLEARLLSGATRRFLLSGSVQIDGTFARGDAAELILAPAENEVFFVEPYTGERPR